MFRFTLFFFLAAVCLNSKAQNDSAKVAEAFANLINICSSVDLKDTNLLKKGAFAEAAKYVVYRGENENRKWKDVADYSVKEERKEVDGICGKIITKLLWASSWKITAYEEKKESEGKWCMLTISYTKEGTEKKAYFAFLKIRGNYALGDID